MTSPDLSILEGPQYREAQIEAVEDDAEKREILMRAVPYGVETQLTSNLFEEFAPKAFERATSDPSRVKLWLGHSDAGGKIVGQAIEVRDESDGVWIRARVSRTTAGDELLTLARDKVLDEASIEFHAVLGALETRRKGENLHVRHKRGVLRGVALVPHGAYGRNALVTSVREQREQEVEKRRMAAIEALRALNH